MEDNELIDIYRYGENGYAVVWPYDVDMEAIMVVIEKIVDETSSEVFIEANKYGAFSTNPEGFTCRLNISKDKGFEAFGLTMREACYNCLIKYIKQ